MLVRLVALQLGDQVPPAHGALQVIQRHDIGQFGEAAIRAVKLIKAGNVDSPEEAWQAATAEIGYDKGCPKEAF